MRKAIELNKNQVKDQWKNGISLHLRTNVHEWRSMTTCFKMNDILFENTIQVRNSINKCGAQNFFKQKFKLFYVFFLLDKIVKNIVLNFLW